MSFLIVKITHRDGVLPVGKMASDMCSPLVGGQETLWTCSVFIMKARGGKLSCPAVGISL